MDPAYNIKIVAEDLTDYLITTGHPSGRQTAQWVAKSALRGSVAAQWEQVRDESFGLLNLYQQDRTIMDALGTEFVNICFEPRVMHAVIEEPGSLAVWNTLTTKYPGCEMVCPPTKVDHIACQAYENGLRAAAHQAMSPLSGSGRFEAPSQKQSNPGPPTFYSNRPRSDMPDAEVGGTQMPSAIDCQDLPFKHDDASKVVFKCEMPEHGDNKFHTCTACSEDAVMLLTAQQQDVYDFGAIFPLCRDCGLRDVNDDISQRTCTCLTPETKCSSCIWMTLNGLVETKKRAMTRTCHGKQCFDCRAILDGRETIGKCSYCCGLEINEPN